MAMREIRAAVVGAGRLGSLHAAKYAALPGVKLTQVVDIDAARATQLGSQYGAASATDFRALDNTVDVVTVASPGVTHFEIASHLLRAGCDVLLEKPMAATVEDARALTALAESTDRILQIGHLERFNPVVNHLRSILNRPRFVECHRLAPFTERGTDVDVVLDLMVHDLDVLLSLTGAEATSVEALGVAVLTDQIDVANARIRFSNGMIANVNTSRVAPRRERKIRFFQPDAYISVDYEARRIQIYRKSPPPDGSTFPIISAEQIDLGEADPLADEVASFIVAVRDRGTPAVTARDGLRVIELIERIRICMEQP
jgi:predicted dehydrogenase